MPRAKSASRKKSPAKKKKAATKASGKDNIYINKTGLKALTNYKYSGGGYTPLDNFLNPFWYKCAEFFPMWFAPNLITFLGLLGGITPYLLYWKYQGADTWGKQTDETEEWWKWVNIVSAFCLWFYQTMDAADGKQARRTGSSSPLGQLFDHGCDALITVFSTAQVCSAVRFPEVWHPLAFAFSVQLPFYLAQWEEMHTHEFRSGIGFLGVTEAQYTVILTNLFVAFYGNNIMHETLFTAPLLGDISLALGCLYAQLGVGIVFSFSFITNTFAKTKDSTAAFMQIVPVIILALFSKLMLATPQYENNPRLIMFLVGLVFAYLTSNMIVTSVCKMEFPLRRNFLIVLGIPLVFRYPELLYPDRKSVV